MSNFTPKRILMNYIQQIQTIVILPEKRYSVKEACIFLGIHRCTIYDYISIQQVPEQFTDYGKSQQLQEVLHSVSGMPEALCNEKGEHRKSDAPKAAHDLVKVRAVFH